MIYSFLLLFFIFFNHKHIVLSPIFHLPVSHYGKILDLSLNWRVEQSLELLEPHVFTRCKLFGRGMDGRTGPVCL